MAGGRKVDLTRYEAEIKRIMDEIGSLESGEYLEDGEEQGMENVTIIAKTIRVLFLELLVKMSNDAEGPGDPFSDFF